MKSDSGDQQPDILDTPKQKRFSDFLGQTKEELIVIIKRHFRLKILL